MRFPISRFPAPLTFVIAAMLLLIPGISSVNAADETAPAPAAATTSAPPPPKAVANFTANAPAIDGVWSPGEWDSAEPVLFPQPDPAAEARILWTNDGLYVTFCATDTTPVFGSAKQGDPLYLEDVFELFIDEGGDHRQFVEIQLDPAGQLYMRNNVLTAPPRVNADGRLTQEFVEREMWRYVPPIPEGIRVACHIDKATSVWIAELFLPAAFIQKRKGGAPMQLGTWRLNLVRHDWTQPASVAGRQSKMMYWAPVLPGCPHISPTRMGYLELRKP